MIYFTESTSSDLRLDDATREKMVSVINGGGVCMQISFMWGMGYELYDRSPGFSDSVQPVHDVGPR